MPATYKAILRGDRLEWSDKKPQDLSEGQPVPVQVTILDDRHSVQFQSHRGQRMAKALEQIAESSAFPQDVDPLDWEREQRQERTLPDRDA